MVKLSSLLTHKSKLCILSVLAIVLYCYSLGGALTSLSQVNNALNRESIYSICVQQCPSGYEGCATRVLQRNEAPKWLAIWLPSKPEVDVSHLTAIPGWKTVIVGDGVCPRGCRFPNCVFLDPASQTILGSSLAPLLPPNDPAKKNLAYLYAIKQQAHFIYDTNVNIRPLHNLSDFFYGNTSGLVYTGKGIFNYYKHYGEHWFQPPGFVYLEQQTNNRSAYVLSDISQPEVQYGLVKVKDKSGPRFQSVVPTVFVGSQSFAPFDSSNTMFHRRAFWGLFTFPGPNGDIVRSFCLQTLLKYIHGHVGFVHPNAKYEQVLQEEKKPKMKFSDKLVQFLYKWQCKHETSFLVCFTQLSAELLAEDIIQEDTFLTMNVWLSDLVAVGYNITNVVLREPHKLTPETNKLRLGTTSTTVELSPFPGVYYNKNPGTQTYQSVMKICENFTYPSSRKRYEFKDILLIVTFNSQYFYANIGYVESLYRRYFPHILFCGPDIQSFGSAVTSLPVNSSVTYVAGIERGWKYFQECTVYAMKMNFRVEGYLQIGDDTLVNSWNLRSLPRDKLWFIHSEAMKASRYNSDLENWGRWAGTSGKTALNMTFTHIETIAKRSGNTKENQFYTQYIKNIKNFHDIFHQTCDFFYIPARLKERFTYFTQLFFNSTLLVEAAIPTMLLGLDDEENIIRVNGTVIWNGSRNNVWKFFKTDDHFLHPFKRRVNMKLPRDRKFMCETFLPTLVKRMEQH